MDITQYLRKYEELSKNKAIQEYIKDNHCYGCGSFNQQGLKIKSYWDGNNQGLCLYHPKEYQCGGTVDVVNSGILVMVMDCHCGALTVAAEYKKENRELGSSPNIWCVTASTRMDFLKPTSLKSDLNLMFYAEIKEKKVRKTVVSCSVISDGIETAKGEVVSVRVK